MLTEEQEIIERMRNGDQAAFRKIVEEYRQPAFSMAFRIVCNEEEARDVVQDSFIKVWLNIGTFKIEHKFSAWIFKIVVNTAIDRVRQLKRHPAVNLDDVIRTIDRIYLDSAQAEIDNEENARLINWLADGLPEKQRIVFVLRDLQGMGAQEVSKLLNMRETLVKSNLYHARAAIRAKLDKTTK